MQTADEYIASLMEIGNKTYGQQQAQTPAQQSGYTADEYIDRLLQYGNSAQNQQAVQQPEQKPINPLLSSPMIKPQEQTQPQYSYQSGPFKIEKPQGAPIQQTQQAEQQQTQLSQQQRNARDAYLRELRELEAASGYITDAQQGLDNANRRRELTDAIKAIDEEEAKIREEQEGPQTDPEKEKMIAELRQLEAEAANITDEQQGLENASRRRELTQALEAHDQKMGYNPRYYDELTRAGGVLEGWANRTGGAYLSTLGTLGQLAEQQDEIGRKLTDSDYSGYLTDEMAIAQARQAVENGWEPKSNGSFQTNKEMLEKADELLGRNAQIMAKVYNGVSGADRILADATGGALDLATDFVMNKILPGSGLAMMGARSFGQGAYDMRQQGKTVGQQILGGAKSAAIEILTEKIGGPFEDIYGKTLTGRAINGFLGKIDNPLVKTGLQLASGFLSEGGEEVMSDLLNPIFDRVFMLDNMEENNGNILKPGWLEDTLYDGLIGGLLGLAGEGANISRNGGTVTSADIQAAKEAGVQGALAAVDRAFEESKTAEPAEAPQTPQSEANPLAETVLRQTPQNGAGAQIDSGGQMTQPQGQENPAVPSPKFNSQTEGQAPTAPSQVNIDNAAEQGYNTSIRETEGISDDQGRSADEAGRGVAPGEEVRGTLPQGGNGPDGNPVSSGIIRVSPELQSAYQQSGVADYGLTDSSGDSAAYSVALEEGRNSDPEHGWMVTPQTAKDLQGKKLLLAQNGSVGVVVTSDGDIEGVFKNKNTGKPGALMTLLPQAIENGGTKLDCYGEGLVHQYEQYGFIPVARVEFNEEFANPGWDESKGRPYVYVMMHNGDSASSVVQNRKDGAYHLSTQAELDQLPTYGKWDYDKATAYRDSLLAERNNKRYQELGQKYGTIEAGENAARESNVPKQIDETRKTGETARTIYEAEATPESRLPDIRNAVIDGKFAHVSVSNEALANEASKQIEKDGWEKALRDWTADVRAGKANEKLAAMGATLLNNAANSTMSGEEYIDLVTDYNALMHNLGRGLAAARILKTLSPSARLYAIQKTVDRYNAERKSGRKVSAENEADLPKYKDIKIDPALVEEFKNAKTDAERDEVISKMQQNIADQVPATAVEKWNALRYLNMLGNFKTQIRNVLGNTTMMLTAMAKNHIVKPLIEGLYGTVNKNYEKTSAVAYDPDLYAEAKKDWESVKKEAMGERKYSDVSKQFENEIEEKRRIFKFMPLEAYRKATNWAMEAGDVIFSRANYADAMAGWMKAHKVEHISDMSPEMLERARNYAIKQAQEATFRDTNAVSSWASKLGRGGKDTRFGKAVSLVSEGIAPFRKTPANVMVRAWEYSPFGFLTALGKKFAGVTDAQGFIEDLSKSFTGSGIAVLGYFLRAAGKLRLPDDDDKKEYFNKDRGLQDYSFITDNGKSITLDWLAPDCIPLFVGAELYEVLSNSGMSGEDAMKILGQMADPMLEMSMLSGLNDTLVYAISNNNTMGALPSLVAYSLLSYLGQGLGNSLIRQGEQASEQNRRTTYTDADSAVPRFAQRKVSQLLAGVPGIDYQQGDYIDGWGRRQDQGNAGERVFQAFFNPAYVREDQSTPYDDELLRLHDAGMTSVIPQTPSRSTKVNDVQLTPEEWETYATTAGEKKLELIGDFLDSEEYKSMNDEERAEIIENLYKYANYTAAREIAQSRGEEYKNSSMDKLAEIENAGIDIPGYLAGKKQANEDGEGSLKSQEIYDWLAGSDYSDEQKSAIWDANKGSSEKSWDEYYEANPYTILHKYGMPDETAQRLVERFDATVNSAKRMTELGEAYKAGVDPDTWGNAWDEYKRLDKSNQTATQKAIDFVTWLDKQGKLTQNQKDLLRKQFTFFSQMSANTSTFDKLMDGGLSAQTAADLYDRIGAITPMPGNTGVTQNQKIVSIATSDLSEDEKWAALKVYASESCYNSAMQARAQGKTFEQWAKSYVK